MIIVITSVIIGLIIGLSLTFIFNILPESWLQDYDYDPKSPNYRPSKRMRLGKEGIVSAIVCACFYGLTASVCYQDFADKGQILHLLTIFLLIPVVILVMLADRLNRIIPDQFSIYIILLSIVSICADAIEGSWWFSSSAPWYYPVISRIIAALVGGGFLWLIEFFSETFLGKEGMGQGDMKLLGASGLLCGVYGLIVLIYAAVFSALLFAIPLLVRKRIRIYKEEKMIRESGDPVAARRKLRLEKSRIHFADNPDYLAFGPFLAFGAAIFMSIEPFWAEKALSTLMDMGVYF